MDALNLRVLVNLSGGATRPPSRQKVDYIRSSRTRTASACSPTWTGTAPTPGWAEKAVADLEQAVRTAPSA
jgi:hypothetical protein